MIWALISMPINLSELVLLFIQGQSKHCGKQTSYLHYLQLQFRPMEIFQHESSFLGGEIGYYKTAQIRGKLIPLKYNILVGL